MTEKCVLPNHCFQQSCIKILLSFPYKNCLANLIPKLIILERTVLWGFLSILLLKVFQTKMTLLTSVKIYVCIISAGLIPQIIKIINQKIKLYNTLQLFSPLLISSYSVLLCFNRSFFHNRNTLSQFIHTEIVTVPLELFLYIA